MVLTDVKHLPVQMWKSAVADYMKDEARSET